VLLEVGFFLTGMNWAIRGRFNTDWNLLEWKKLVLY
jgi:hypothetical protein